MYTQSEIMFLFQKAVVTCVEVLHTNAAQLHTVQHCGSFLAYRSGGWRKRQMGNNRKDMTDQPGEGKKYSHRNRDEIQ